MIPHETIERIKSKIDIIDVIGTYVHLKKRGTNYIGNCPFHNEKTPSFTVSPAKEIFKCFGCGKSGNTITFLMENEKLSYVEALKWLAGRYNIAIEEEVLSPEKQLQFQVADSLYIINNFANEFFQNTLHQTEEGKTIALPYLFHRKFTPEIIEKFQLGYDGRYDNLLAKALKANQFNPEIVFKSGLVIQKNEEWIDNYRGRIIFPIHNAMGKVMGFGARIMGNADKSPKYINTPETEIYVKNKTLYGLFFARQSIAKNDECFLVEGYTDVISLAQAGIENVVASGGTSLTIEQLKTIKKITNQLTILYDGDQAGIKAALRGLNMALAEQLEVRLVLFPKDEDPDSFIQNVGRESFLEYIQKNKKDFILFQAEILLADVGEDINKKNRAVQSIAESISKLNRIEDFNKQQNYIQRCAELLKISELGLTQLVNKIIRDELFVQQRKISTATATIEATVKKEDEEEAVAARPIVLEQLDDIEQEKKIVLLLLENGLSSMGNGHTVATYIFTELAQFHLQNQPLQDVYELYKKYYDEGAPKTFNYFLTNPDKSIEKTVHSLHLIPPQISNNWYARIGLHKEPEEETIKRDVAMSVQILKLRKLKKMLDENQKDLLKAVPEEQMSLMHIHRQLKEIEMSIAKVLGTVILK